MKILFVSLLFILGSVWIVAAKSVKVVVINPADIARTFETIELSWKDIAEKFPEEKRECIIVTDESGKLLPSQVTANALIFQIPHIEPLDSLNFRLKQGKPKEVEPMAYGRLVPERMDDWAWENNRIAFRIYGPALQATGEISNGIDVWLKRTDRLIIDKWYAPGVDYHTDHGEGLDCYKVGRTLGAGAMAPLDGKTLALGANFVKAELVDSGAIRTTVRLFYAPFKAGDKHISEERIISLDANSNFNRITEFYSGNFDSIPAVAGIILHGMGDIKIYSQAVAYTEPENGNNGRTHLALIMPRLTKVDTVQEHLAAHVVAYNGVPLTYLSGAAWDKYLFMDVVSWQNEIEKEVIKWNHPLKIEFR